MGENISEILSCGHCSNISRMQILGSIYDNDEYYEGDEGPFIDSGTTYQVLVCPACKKKNLVRFDWYEEMENEHIQYEMLYPTNDKTPLGLPQDIQNAYKAAERVKTVDVNAYAILLRRLLELVCLDRNASGGTLASMLQDLSNKGEIPEKLVRVAKGLKDLGNVGAHAAIGELKESEIPIIKALIQAILEYIYSAPRLAEIAENKLNQLRSR